MTRFPRHRLTVAAALAPLTAIGLASPVRAAATPGACTLSTGTSNSASCTYVAGASSGEVAAEAFATGPATVAVTVSDVTTGQTVVSGCGAEGVASLTSLCDYPQTVGDTYQVTVQTALTPGLVNQTNSYAERFLGSSTGASDSVTAVAVAQDAGSLAALLTTVNGLLSTLP